MKEEKKIRCVNINTGLVKYLVPLIANNPIRMKSIGYRIEELPSKLPNIFREAEKQFGKTEDVREEIVSTSFEESTETIEIPLIKEKKQKQKK